MNTSARSAARAYYNARFDGQAYSWQNLTYNYSAADTILLVKNTHATKKLHLHSIVVSGDAATEVVVHRPTSEVTTPTGTAVVGVNLNGTSSNVAGATAKADETTNSIGDRIISFRIPADTPIIIPLDDIISLSQNQSIGVDFVTVGAAANVTIIGYFEDDDA